MTRRCKVCGAAYQTCYICEQSRSWRTHTDTLDHYRVFMALMEYRTSHHALQAYRALRKCGVSFHKTAEFLPDIQRILAEIYTLTQENRRAKEGVVELGVPLDGEPEAEQNQ